MSNPGGEGYFIHRIFLLIKTDVSDAASVNFGIHNDVTYVSIVYIISSTWSCRNRVGLYYGEVC